MTVERLTLEPDHLIVWGDVDVVGAEIAHALGLEPADGGVHPAGGTRNLLFAMDGDRFLEVLGPDPSQPSRSWGPDDDRPDGMLWWWAARTTASLRDVGTLLSSLGVPAGPVEPGARIRPNGERLEWETIDPDPGVYGAALPFAIRWKGDPPMRDHRPVCGLREFWLRHPDVEGLRAVLLGLGLSVDVERAESPGLRATIEGPGGDVLWLRTPTATG